MVFDSDVLALVLFNGLRLADAFRWFFAEGEIGGTLCMRSHISVQRATIKYFSNSFVFKTKIEKEGLPRDGTPDLGAGGRRVRISAPRPFTHSKRARIRAHNNYPGRSWAGCPCSNRRWSVSWLGVLPVPRAGLKIQQTAVSLPGPRKGSTCAAHQHQ